MTNKKKYLQNNYSSHFPHIDGLRAVAVILVVLFHIEKNIFSLAYIGVDIFFVISGYVITKQITEQFNKEEFSFLSFYRRRFKRIYPALILVIFITGIFYLYYGLHYNFTDFNIHLKTAFYSLFGLSNIYLTYKSRDYFFDTETNPFIHTWSLGVEEQFYVIWPIILISLLYIFRKNLEQNNKKIFLFIVFIIIINVIFSLTEHKYSNLSNQFFSPTFRFWELALGSSLHFLKSSKKNFQIFVIVAISLIFFTDNKFFIMVITCIGSALVIYNKNNQSIINLILSNPILTLIGRMSYSIYLWHLSILIVGDFFFPVQDNLFKYILIILVISYLSYRLVECPIRFSKKYDKAIERTLLVGVFLIPLFFIFGSNLNVQLDKIIKSAHNSNFNFFSNKFGENIFTNNRPFYFKHGACQMDWSFLVDVQKDLKKIPFTSWENEILYNNNNHCYLKKNSNKFILFIGDSSSTALANIVDIDGYDSLSVSLGGFLISNNYSAIIKNNYQKNDISRIDRDDFYRDFVTKIFNKLSVNYKDSYILISSRIDQKFLFADSNKYKIINKKNKKSKFKLVDYQRDVHKFLERFQNNPKVIFFRSMPTFKDTLQECVAKIVVDKNYDCKLPKDNLLEQNFYEALMFKNLISTYKDKYSLFSLNKLICPNENCNFFFKKGQSWVTDTFHANPETISDPKIKKYFKNFINNIK